MYIKSDHSKYSIPNVYLYQIYIIEIIILTVYL